MGIIHCKWMFHAKHDTQKLTEKQETTVTKNQ